MQTAIASKGQKKRDAPFSEARKHSVPYQESLMGIVNRFSRNRRTKKPVPLPRVRPHCAALDDRHMPSLSVSAVGGDLIITGTPIAITDFDNGIFDSVQVLHVGGHNYQ